MSTFFTQPNPTDGKDTHIQFLDLAWNNNNFGVDFHLEMGARITAKTGDDVLERGLIEFDLSGVPGSLVVEDARVHFQVTEAPPNITTWEVVRLIQDFVKGTGGVGNGASGTTHDGSTAWPGGDGALADTDATDRATFNPPTTIGPFSIDIKALVIDAIDNRSGILRLLIRDQNEVPATDTRFVVWKSNAPVAKNRPSLRINANQGRHVMTMGAG